MLIAHLSAGYVLTKYLQKTSGNHRYLWLGLLASILPDCDMIYFYVIDQRQTNHHEYITHLPLFWVGLCIYCMALMWVLRCHKKHYYILGVFFSNIGLHMVLDSYTGYIKWLYPLFYGKYNLIEVPAMYDWWVWSFVLHWSFLVELAIIAVSMVVLIRSRRCKKSHTIDAVTWVAYPHG